MWMLRRHYIGLKNKTKWVEQKKIFKQKQLICSNINKNILFKMKERVMDNYGVELY